MIILTQRGGGFDHCWLAWGESCGRAALQNRINKKTNADVIEAWSFRATSMEDMELVEAASSLFIPPQTNAWIEALAG